MLYLFNNGKGGTAFFTSVGDVSVRKSNEDFKSADPDAPFVVSIDGNPLPAYTGHSVHAFTDDGAEVAVFDYQGAL